VCCGARRSLCQSTSACRRRCRECPPPFARKASLPVCGRGPKQSRSDADLADVSWHRRPSRLTLVVESSSNIAAAVRAGFRSALRAGSNDKRDDQRRPSAVRLRGGRRRRPAGGEPSGGGAACSAAERKRFCRTKPFRKDLLPQHVASSLLVQRRGGHRARLRERSASMPASASCRSAAGLPLPPPGGIHASPAPASPPRPSSRRPPPRLQSRGGQQLHGESSVFNNRKNDASAPCRALRFRVLSQILQTFRA